MRRNDPFGLGSIDLSGGIDPLTGRPLKKNIKRDSRRSFSSSQRKEILAQQNNKCAVCHKSLDMRTVEFDHVKAWADKGRTIVANGAALCPHCHKIKTHNERLKKVDKKRKSKKQESDPLGISTFKQPRIDPFRI